MQKRTLPGFIALVLLLSTGLTGCIQSVRVREAPAAFRWSSPDDPYLVKLRTNYDLARLTADKRDDYARAQAVTLWVAGLWRQDGSHQAKANDPISIIEAARKGERFRCVEYSIVLAGALTSIGIPARILALKTADVETRKSGAGHLVAEAYLPDQKRWVMLDGQWGAMAERSGVPLSAVEFRQALAEAAPDLKLAGLPAGNQAAYIEWIKPYLYYMDVPFDNRVGVANRSQRALMLVPDGASEPKVFQGISPLDYLTYTRSVAAFYPVPPLSK